MLSQKNISSCSINSPKGSTSSVKASHWCNVKDSFSDLCSPGELLIFRYLLKQRDSVAFDQ